MKLIVYKYYVRMVDANGSNNRAKEIIAISEEEAIESTRHEKWWYDEGTGKNAKNIKYPVIFTATLVE